MMICFNNTKTLTRGVFTPAAAAGLTHRVYHEAYGHTHHMEPSPRGVKLMPTPSDVGHPVKADVIVG